MIELIGSVMITTVVSAVLGADPGGIIYAAFIYKGSEIRIFAVCKRTDL